MMVETVLWALEISIPSDVHKVRTKTMTSLTHSTLEITGYVLVLATGAS